MKRFLKAALLTVLCVAALGALAACSGSDGASKSSEQLQANDTAASADENVFYALLVGEDTRYGTKDQTDETEDGPDFSDVNILARVDMNEYRVSLLSIPRDTEIQMGEETTKLNTSYFNGGINDLISKVEGLTGVEIPYYFTMTFATFAQYIDELGGVTVDVPVPISVGDPINGGRVTLQAGEQTLDGADALGFGRMRKNYVSNHDACRQIQDRQMVASIIEKVANEPTSKAGDYATILERFADTNMSVETLTQYVTQFMEHASELKIQSGTGPYEGYEVGGQWLVPSEPDTYARLIEAMETDSDMEAIVPLPYVAIN